MDSIAIIIAQTRDGRRAGQSRAGAEDGLAAVVLKSPPGSVDPPGQPLPGRL